jgi:hypothetical protein
VIKRDAGPFAQRLTDKKQSGWQSDGRGVEHPPEAMERTWIVVIVLMSALTFFWIIAPDRICDVDMTATGIKGLIQHVERPVRVAVAGNRTEAECVGRMALALGVLFFGGGMGLSGLLLWRRRRVVQARYASSDTFNGTPYSPNP